MLNLWQFRVNFEMPDIRKNRLTTAGKLTARNAVVKRIKTSKMVKTLIPLKQFIIMKKVFPAEEGGSLTKRNRTSLYGSHLEVMIA